MDTQETGFAEDVETLEPKRRADGAARQPGRRVTKCRFSNDEKQRHGAVEQFHPQGCPQEARAASSQGDVCTPTFTAASLPTAESRKQCPPTSARTESWRARTTERDSALPRKGVLARATTRTDPEDVVLSDTSQAPGRKRNRTPCELAQTRELEQTDAQGRGERGRGERVLGTELPPRTRDGPETSKGGPTSLYLR